MNARKPVAFYAPLKSPDHPSPSGDRTMARLLMKALAAAGFAPHLASTIRTLDLAGDPRVQEECARQSRREAERLIAEYSGRARAQRPCLWFTYHVYYKAPDWIGPRVAAALDIPYVVAEGSRAAKRADGPWALGHAGAEAALDSASAIFVMTAHDRPALERARPAHQDLIDLPPFLDAEDWPKVRFARTVNEARLLTVAMMREGDKLASYRLLAAALEKVTHLPWTLDIVGDGEARGAVTGLFRPFGNRIRFHGRIERRADLRALYEGASLFVWPAVNEAYGMALLEAQLFGCPVVAGAYGGVASVMKDGETGLLTPPGDGDAFAQAVASLIKDEEHRQRLALAARHFVAQERLLAHAALRLKNALTPLVNERGENACAS